MVGGLEAFLEPGAERQERHLRSFADDSSLADFEGHAPIGNIDADAFPARVAEGRRPIIDCRCRRDHMDELGFIGGGHHHKIGQAGEIGDIEAAGMRRAVLADQPGAIDRQSHRNALQRDVMDDLVVGALQERRIDRAERLESFDREPGGKGHRMLLGDPDIEHPLRKAFGEFVEPSSRRHRRGDGDYLLVLLCLMNEALREDRGVGRSVDTLFVISPVLPSKPPTA